MLLIGLTGYKRSGKDTVAHMLSEIHTQRMHEQGKISPVLDRAFADPIYDMMHAMLFGTVERCIPDQMKAEPIEWLDGVTPRRLLQTLGTEWGRNTINPNLWVTLAEHWLYEHSNFNPHPGYFIFTDVRFPNEVDFIARMGGVIVKVVRQGNESNDNHESESYINDILPDFYINNNVDKRGLMTEVDVLHSKLENIREQRPIRWQ